MLWALGLLGFCADPDSGRGFSVLLLLLYDVMRAPGWPRR